MTLTPERWHQKNHQLALNFVDCRRCGRARSTCRSKQRFDTWQDADAAVRAKNESDGYARPVVRYPCRWCPGWHMTTARGRVQVRRAERQRRKWLIGVAAC
jgi:hypothetical protein